MTTIGIDFGTSNSVVATWSGGGPEVLSIDSPLAEWENLGFDRIMPSVFARGTGNQAQFGWAAKRSQSGRFEAVKRLFATQGETITDDAGGSFVVEEVATMLFAELRAAALRQGVDARDAVVTVPANSRGLARHRTKICAAMGGLNVLALINEPTAAAMAYAARNPGDQQLLVFDWGGGTLDVTILRSTGGVFMEQASKGLPTRGGIDFDTRARKAILDSVEETSRWSPEERRRFELDVELAKVKLSSDESTVVQLPSGDSRRLTRARFEKEVRSLIDEARQPIERCLADIGAGPGSIDSVVMVGGTSKIPAIRTFVAEMLGCDPEVGIDPMTAVGEGAAIAAAILTDELETNDFFVATEHALGTVTFDPTTNDQSFSVLIPRNHKLPARRTETYVPFHPEQASVSISVIEGDPDEPVDHPDNVVLKAWTVPVPGETGSPNRSFDMTYDYDVDGILHITVVDNLTGATMLSDDIADGVTDDKRELVRIAKRARQTVDGRDLTPAGSSAAHADPEANELIERARNQVIDFLDDDEKADVIAAVTALEQASPDDLESLKARLRDVLTPYGYLF